MFQEHKMMEGKEGSFQIEKSSTRRKVRRKKDDMFLVFFPHK